MKVREVEISSRHPRIRTKKKILPSVGVKEALPEGSRTGYKDSSDIQSLNRIE